MSISEKVAYLKGLMEGLNLQDSDEVRLIKSIADILSEMAAQIAELGEETGELSDYVEELDSDLGDLEEALFGDACTCDEDCDCGCQDGEPCDCDEDCDCGCQDGEPCTCGDKE